MVRGAAAGSAARERNTIPKLQKRTAIVLIAPIQATIVIQIKASANGTKGNCKHSESAFRQRIPACPAFPQSCDGSADVILIRKGGKF